MRNRDLAARRRLGEAINRRRGLLRLTQADLAERVGMSIDTVRALETASRTIRISNLARFEESLEWPTGTCEAILDGREIDEPTGTVDDDDQDENGSTLNELESALVALITAFGAREVATALARVLGRVHQTPA